MKAFQIKTYQIVVFFVLLYVGILLMALLSEPIRYVGAILIFIDILYSGSIYFTNLGVDNQERFRSRVRDQLFEFQIEE